MFRRIDRNADGCDRNADGSAARRPCTCPGMSYAFVAGTSFQARGERRQGPRCSAAPPCFHHRYPPARDMSRRACTGNVRILIGFALFCSAALDHFTRMKACFSAANGLRAVFEMRKTDAIFLKRRNRLFSTSRGARASSPARSPACSQPSFPILLRPRRSHPSVHSHRNGRLGKSARTFR